MTDTLELLKRYNGPTPRYTSYPPAPHWQPAHRGLLMAALRKSTAALSIYVHIPFCERLCLYCGCNVVIKKDHSVADAYVQNLIEEMDLAEVAHRRLVTQMHWGGGTPRRCAGIRCISSRGRGVDGCVIEKRGNYDSHSQNLGAGRFLGCVEESR